MRKTAKRIVSLLLAAVMVLGAAPLSGFVGLDLPDITTLFAPKAEAATNGTCGENISYSLDKENRILTIFGQGEMYNYSYTNYAPWNKIYGQNDMSFYVNSVIIESGVTNIGAYAFSGCTYLKSIVISDTVTSIGTSAFSGCSGLNGVLIPENVHLIGSFAFAHCDSLTKVTIPDSVIAIGASVFSECEKLSEVVIGDGLREIPYEAFRECGNLSTVIIGQKVVDIGESAFYGCTSLDGVCIPKNVENIGNSAFAGCWNLLCVNFAENSDLKNIGDSAFGGSTSLSDINIPDSVLHIGRLAFIGTQCYDNAENWENGVLYIGNHLIIADTTISGEYKIKANTKSIADNAFSSCQKLTSISVSEEYGLASIGKDCFSYCTELSKITIPNSVVYIGEDAFYGTKYYENNTNWDNGVLYIGNHLIKAKKTIKDIYEVREETQTIANKAFYEITNITSIRIPDSVKRIGDSAFSNCESLENIILTESSYLKSIGNYAFCDCSKLTDFKIPSKVVDIGQNAFIKCKNITSINIPSGVTAIRDRTFSSCISLVDVILEENSGISYVGEDAFYECYNLEKIFIPKATKRIDRSAFRDCSSITDVYYEGTKEAWDEIIIFKSSNETFLNATIHFESSLEELPESDETSHCINIPENIIYIDVDEHYIFNAYSDTGENITDKVIWGHTTSVGDEGNVEFVSPGQIKGLKSGLTNVWVDYWNEDKTEFYGSDSCLVYIGKPSELSYTSIYDTEYGFGEGGFYSDTCQISNTVDIYLELNNKIAEEIDFCLEYDKFHDELSKLDIGEFTITATVTGDDLSFEKNSYSNTYTQKFDSVPIGMSVSDLLILHPYNLDVSGAQKSYTVSVKIESEDFETITENFSFNISSLELKNINEHIDFVKNNSTYKSFKNKDFASNMASLKNDGQYIWAKYSTMDFNNYYEIMFADILVDLMSAPQTGSVSILPVIKEWVDSYNTILSGVSNIVEDDYTGYLDVNENAVDKIIKKSKYTTEGMDVHDELRDFVVLKLRDKVSMDKVNSVFAAVDKTQQFCDFFELSVDITNDIAEFANCISIINAYKGMNDEFKEVIKNLYYAIPDSESNAKDAVYHYVNIDSEIGYSDEIFNAVKNLAKNITLDVFNKVYKQQFFSLLGKCIGSITLKSGALLSSTSAFSSISAGLGAVATGVSMGLCISDILCNNSGQAEKMGKVVAASVFAPYALQLLDNYEKDMRISKTVVSVKLFENAFNLHKAIQIYSLKNTFDALKIQADSTIIKLFSNKDYAGLMSDIAAQKTILENCNCCGSGKSTTIISVKTIEIKCPVDVYLYDENGNEVVRIIKDVAEFVENGISVFLEESRKYITVPADQEYTIKIIATEDGEMTYSIAEYNETAQWIRTVNIQNISLVESKIFIGKINQELSPYQDFYALECEGGLIKPTDIVYPSDENIIAANIDILDPSTTTITYGDSITLHAELNATLSEGAYVEWSTNNSNFRIVSLSLDDLSCKITPEVSGDTEITVTVYDIEDNVICSDSQTMTAKAGFFQKIIAFFKKLFVLTKDIPNVIKKVL